MNQKKERCQEAIIHFYQKESLYRLYKEYFLDWIAEGKIGKDLDLFTISLIGPKTEKETFLDLLEEFYLEEEKFKPLFDSLDEEVQEIFCKLVWGERYYLDAKNRERYFSEENRFLKELAGKYSFFKLGKDVKNKEYFYLDYDIVQQIRQFMKKPKEVHLQAVKTPVKMWKDNNEAEIMQQLEKYYDFYIQGGVSLSNSGKILKESKVNMKKYCSIKEYYNNAKDLDFLKTETLALFFCLLKDEYKIRENFQAKNRKQLILDLLSTDLIREDKYIYSSLFLNYLKGVKNIWQHEEYLKEMIQSVRDILGELKAGMTVSVDNIVKAMVFQDKFCEFIHVQDVKDYIYINEANYERTRITNHDRYYDYIILPFVKSFLCLLSALGVFEVYYDMPVEDNYLYLKTGYLSKYDGMRYIRFTNFGEYVFGLRDKYEVQEQQDESEVILDKERLIITLLGDAPTRTMFLERIGQKIVKNKYKITKESFLRGLEGGTSLEERIEEFHAKIPSPKPSIWLNFLEELTDKSKAITWQNDYRVLKLKEDKELISIFMKDKRFNQYVLKGEEYHIFVKESNIGLLSKLLKEYGYYMNW